MDKNYLGTNCPIQSKRRIARDIPVGPAVGSLVKQKTYDSNPFDKTIPHRNGWVVIPGKLSVQIKYVDDGEKAWGTKEFLEVILECR